MSEETELEPRSVSNDVLEPLRSHRAFIVLFVLSTSLASLLFTYVYSELYRGEATIFFQPQAYPRVNAQQLEALGSPVPSAPFKVIGQTLSALAASDAVLRAVVTDLRLDDIKPDYSGPWYVSLYKQYKDYLMEVAGDALSILKFGRIIEENRTAKAIAELRKRTKVEHEDSYVFVVKTTYKRADIAAAAADAVAEQLINSLRVEYQGQATAEAKELRKLLDEKNEKLEELNHRLRTLLISNNVGAFPQEIEQGTVRLSELRLSLAKAEAQLRLEKARVKEIGAKLGSLGGLGASRGLGVATDIGQNYARFSTEKLAAEVNVAGLIESRNSTEESIAKLQETLARLTQVQVEHDALSTELQTTKRDVVVLSGALQETMIRQTATPTDLRMQNRAVTPEKPISPIKIYHVGLAAFLAAVISVGLAYMLSHFNIFYFANRRRTGRAASP